MGLFTERDRKYYSHSRGNGPFVQHSSPLSLDQKALVIDHFELFTAAVIELVHELLQVPVLAVDTRGKVIAASCPEWEALPLETVEPLLLRPYISLPLYLSEEGGQLRIYQETKDETAVALIQKIVRLAIDQVLLAEQLPNYHKLKDEFLYNLLCGLITNPSLIEFYAQKLNLDLTPPRAVILVDASHYVTGDGNNQPYTLSRLVVERRVNSVINCIVDFFSLPNDMICAHMGQGEVAILKATDTKNLINWAGEQTLPSVSSWANLTALKRASKVLLSVLTQTLNSPFTLSIGRHHRGITGLAHSYKDARAALSLGLRYYGANGVHCLDELGMAAFVGIPDEQIKNDLAAHILSPLDHEPEMIETLQAFFKSNCSPSQASSLLSIHRNTLNYRLDKIASLSGLDPRQFDDAVQIRLALLLRAA